MGKRRLQWRGKLDPTLSEKTELVAALQACGDTSALPTNGSTTPAELVKDSSSGAKSFAPGDFAADETEDFSKLSVAELKKRLRWVGATVPEGATEKSELVTALKNAPGIHRAYVPVDVPA